MAGIYVNGNIGAVGSAAVKQFSFLVVKDANHIGLPQSEIDALGLKRSLVATPKEDGDHARTLEDMAYEAGAHFDRCYIELDVRPEPVPTVGTAALCKLGFEVDLERGLIAKPTEPLKTHRGLMPYMLDVSDLSLTTDLDASR